MHNITSKKQHIQQKGIQFDGVLKAGYELSYNYENNPFQISTLQDDNYRTEGQNTPNDLTKKEHAYEYDLNGNLIYVNTSREKKDGTLQEKNNERKLLWDEENRLEAIDDNGFVSNYWYDAAGERTVKTSGESQEMYVNSVFSGGDTQTANFTAYINPYLVVSKGGQYTKHIYIGSQRIVSKLGDLDSYGSDPRRIEYAGANVDGAKVDYATKYTALQQTIKDRYDKFEVPYYGKDNDDYVNGQGFCCDDNVKNTLKFGVGNDNAELYQYYYHSDHLGSSSLITNLDGEVVQHIEYVPFGEVFIEEKNNTWNTPYLFNAKELDEETGLYYYGARYYDPRTSIWLSADPLGEKYPSVSPYIYCVQNPLKFIDPDGLDWIENLKTGELTWDENIKSKGDFGKSDYDQELYSYAGKKTQRAVSLGSTAGMYTIYYGPDGTQTMYDYPNWVDRAKSKIGLTEGNNPVIQEMIDKLNLDFGCADKDQKPINSDSDPWCGVFVYWALEGWDMTSNSWQTPALNTFFSTNWKEKITIDKPAVGAIAVMKYNHVAVVVDYNDTYVWIVGGNQAKSGAAVRDGVEVNISKYRRSLVSKYVLPKSYNKPPLDTF